MAERLTFAGWLRSFCAGFNGNFETEVSVTLWPTRAGQRRERFDPPPGLADASTSWQ
jgi:hypothetical protein